MYVYIYTYMQRLTIKILSPGAADPDRFTLDCQESSGGARYKVGTAVAQGFRRLRMALQDSSVRHVDAWLLGSLGEAGSL